MPPTAPQIFSNISPAQYAVLIRKANDSGLELTGNAGTTTKFGVDVAWEYSPETSQLKIQCLSTPFFMNPKSVNERIRGLVDRAVS